MIPDVAPRAMNNAIRNLLLTVVALVALCGPVSNVVAADVPVGCEPKADPPLLDFSQLPNLDLFKRQLLFYRCTRYDTDIALVLRDAQNWVKQRAPQVTNPAIVLDIDETSLSNWKRIFQDNYPYLSRGACDFKKKGEACGDKDWQWSEQAPAIQPTLDLYRLAQCIDAPSPCTKVDVFFVTGRHEGDKYSPKEVDQSLEKTPTEWTLGNLQKAGFTGATQDHLYMRAKDSSGPVSDHKTKARTAIENGGKVTIIANIGDQESDLVGEHAEQKFKVPNPFYIIP